MKPFILLVDDEPESLRRASELLRSSFDVTPARSGEEALELLRGETEYAVLVTDHWMEGLSGAELLRLAEREGPDLVGILLAGPGEFDHATRALAGVAPFRLLRKPCSMDELRDAIRAAVAHHEHRHLRRLLQGEAELSPQAWRRLHDGLETRLSDQIDQLRILHRLAVELNEAGSLGEIASLAAQAVFEVLRGHAVCVQLWDDDCAAGAVHADRGGEMSTRLRCLPLAAREGTLGEIVVDEVGRDGRLLFDEEAELLEMIAGPTAVAARNELRRRERDKAQHATILALARLAEQRDNETGQHIERVSQYCKLIAEGLRFRGDFAGRIDDEFIDQLVRSAPLHDIGKVGIPDSILLKPGRLAPEEFEIMKTHAALGASTLERVIREGGRPGYLEMGRDIALCHHERWDGTGYPRGLDGEAIPLAARILALADVYDALTSVRPYKEAWPHERAAAFLREQSGRQFDPRIVEAFLSRELEAQAIRRRLADEPVEAFEATPSLV